MHFKKVYEEAKQLAELIGSIEEKPRTVRAGMRQEHCSNVQVAELRTVIEQRIAELCSMATQADGGHGG